ncbi:UBR-type domain-containing protein [Entamoeba marina]
MQLTESAEAINLRLNDSSNKDALKTAENVEDRRNLLDKECDEIHSFVAQCVKNLDYLNNLLFYDKYSDDFSAKVLSKYQSTERCYQLIPPSEECFQCLDCSIGDDYPYIMCKKCRDAHAKWGHSVIQNSTNDVNFCMCGDIFFKRVNCHKYNDFCCTHHTVNSECYHSNDPTIITNISNKFKRVQTIAKLIIPQALIQFCDIILVLVENEHLPDVDLFIMHFLRWLNWIVQINPIREVIRDCMKLEVSTGGKFLLTNTVKKVTKIINEKETTQFLILNKEERNNKVTIHEIFLNLCIHHKPTSEYKNIKKIYSTYTFHTTLLSRLIGPMLSEFSKVELLGYSLNYLIVMIKEKRPLTNLNAMQLFVSMLLSSEQNIIDIIEDEENFKSFIDLCKELTFYPTPNDVASRAVLSELHPLFLAVVTRIRVSEYHSFLKQDIELPPEKEKEIAALHKKNQLINILPVLKTIVFGCDGNTELDLYQLPTHYYIFNLFAILSDVLLRSNSQLPFDYFGIPLKQFTKFLEFSFIMFCALGTPSYKLTVLQIIENKNPQRHLHDFLGEFNYPILYSSLLFIGQICLASTPIDTFLDYLREIANCCEPNGPYRAHFSETNALSYINFICTFSRYAQESNNHVMSYFNYYRETLKHCSYPNLPAATIDQQITSIISSQVHEVKRSGPRFTIGGDRMLSISTSPHLKAGNKKRSNEYSPQNSSSRSFFSRATNNRLSISVTTKSLKYFGSPDAEWCKSKEEVPMNNMYLMYRKQLTGTTQTNQYTVDKIFEKAQYYRRQQKALPDNLDDEKEIDISWPAPKSKKFPDVTIFDLFFPFLNQTCNINFYKNICNKMLIEPLSCGKIKEFLSFVDPTLFTGRFVPVLRTRVEDLIVHGSLFKCLLKGPESVSVFNYLQILRLLWIRIDRRGEWEFFNNDDLVKLLLTCYGYLFVDTFLFIPESSVEALLRHIEIVFCSGALKRSVKNSSDKPIPPITYFVKVIIDAPLFSLFFSNRDFTEKKFQVDDLFSDSTINAFHSVAQKADLKALK